MSASMMNSDFFKARIENSALAYSDARGADFRGASIIGSSFAYAKLDNALFSQFPQAAGDTPKPALEMMVSLPGDYSRIQDTLLNGVSFVRADMEATDFSGAHVQGADFFAARAPKANFRHANLQASNLSVTNIRGADCYSANMTGVILDFSDIRCNNLRSE